MRTLVIGGSVFLGRAIVEEALRRGHEVTTFNRGVSGEDLPGVEAVRGDRESREDLARLADGREWDAVVDVCGFVPRVVGDSVRALNGRAATYAFISSISACSAWPATGPTDEDSPRFECAPDAGPQDGDYGVLKAGCERAVEQGFDGSALIIEPGLILGPHENVGRLPWWLTRTARGGKVLAPGDPQVAMQLVDARDIASFTLSQAEAETADRFFVSGIEGNSTYGGFLDECRTVTGSDAEFVWVDDRFLLDREVQPWTELPLWAPDDPEFAGVWRPSSAKARAAGLVCRPVAETVRDTWAWLREIPEDRRSFGSARLHHGIAPEKEAKILDEWEQRAAG
ncbi:NAD-dependent epimerase/dehydratase family protein [Planomonospora sp. ID67723]|uniref:NAD-dependent epimerase/dehydratase family protein n=1 Tax=Planomonospora sp. ID67723 TaxID=2738134 RepID=UPI0018C36113|nr:NAD-dependent epimerase/dehydratase family protein [Planomonospora sp. ID67723]MBG0830780.1 NAD-dependent epimerase/dehydratase family protein [Planomonospora sp. ID67723]